MLEKFFVSQVRIKLLKLFIFNPESEYHVRGITREIDEEINAVRRELERMAKVNLVVGQKKGNRLYYRIQTDFVLYPEFEALIHKEFGLGRRIIKSKKRIGSVDYAWLTEFFLDKKPKTEHDVDLVVVGDNVDLETLAKRVKDSEKTVGHQINYTVMSTDEFNIRKQRSDNFVMKLLLSRKLLLIGDETELFKH